MVATWYSIVSLMLIVYVALDGRNFGAGMLHWVVAKSPEERRLVIAAIGPLWSWHEVWLVGFGGTLVAVFPRLMASAFCLSRVRVGRLARKLCSFRSHSRICWCAKW